MRFGDRRMRSRFFAAILAAFSALLLAGCEIPPSGIPTEASIRGLRPSGSVTMTQVFVSASGVGSGTLTFRGRTYPFTLVGSLIGLGAISTMQASGEVYKLHDVSQFSGPWIQGTGSLAITTKANGEFGSRTATASSCGSAPHKPGSTFSQGRYELYIHLSQ